MILKRQKTFSKVPNIIRKGQMINLGNLKGSGVSPRNYYTTLGLEGKIDIKGLKDVEKFRSGRLKEIKRLRKQGVDADTILRGSETAETNFLKNLKK